MNHVCRKLHNVKKATRKLSSIASAFNKQTHVEHAEDRHGDTVGLFGIPELRNPEGFTKLKVDVLQRAEKLVDDAVNKSPHIDVVAIFDELSNELCKVADLAEFVRVAHPVEEYAKAAENASFEIGGYVEKLNTHYKLYESLDRTLKQNSSQMDSVTEIVARMLLFDFEQSGIHLKSSKRKQAVELHEASLLLGARFAQNTNLPRLFALRDWPSDVRIPYQISKQSEIVADGSFNESSDARVREMCQRAFFSPCVEQAGLLDGLLYSRDQLAQLLGFPTFPHRTLRGTTAQSPDTVNAFLEQTLSMLEQPFSEEMQMISNYKQDVQKLDGSVHAWDTRYYSGLITNNRYNLNAREISEYFSIGACMDGLNIIFTSLYGVSLNVVPTCPGEVWAPDVQKLEVRSENEGVLGYIYCDFYQRPDKLPQDCHFTIRGGKQLSERTYQLPVVSLVCNFNPPSHHTPSLLTQGMVENLFHEMGHAMHSMLGRARYHHVTGTRCPTDFAEVPSVLMEYFATDRRILPLYAKHYKTGKPLPDKIISALNDSKKLFSAMDLQTQTFYSIVDQKIHGKFELGRSTMAMIDNLHKQYSPLTHVPGSAWHLRFNHFNSYGAKYYAYVWAKACASRIWYACFERDPLSRGAGERYRETMLKHGGGRPPSQMVSDMLGCDVTPRDLVNSLETDLKAQH